ncbi:MAG TPA: ATP-binding cassette domain-containing protein [Polyangia bacterium]
MKAYIQTENATFRGPRGPVFKDTTLTIAPGERWAVVGPNGSGKGLLLAALMGKLGLLAGLLRHPFLEGDARFADSVFGVLPPGTMALASMAEHRQWLLARDYHQLRWHASMSQGRATVARLLERSQVEQQNPFAVLDPAGDRGFVEARQREIARFELAPLLDRPLVALSNGELHRFVLARALLRQPRLLLIDDPIAGLDEHSRQRLRTLLADLDAEGIGVILSTERESDLPDDVTHLMHVHQAAIQSAGPRTRGTGDPVPASRAPAFVMPKVQRRPLPENIPVVEITRATVRQGNATLLDGISLRVEQGEHWALLGPNGSGKSTLLSLILADHPLVYANDVRVAGQSLGPGRSIWDQKAWLGWLSPELETHTPPLAQTFEVVLSGFEHSLGAHGRHSAEQIAAATDWLQHVGLHDRSDTAFADLAPAARRLALLARAAVHGPALLLLDEPCQGLDADGRRALRAAIAAVVESLSAAMIYVTHDPEEIPASATQMLILDQGRARYQGPRQT